MVNFQRTLVITNPLVTGRKLNVHKMFRGCQGHDVNVLRTLNLGPVFNGYPNVNS